MYEEGNRDKTALVSFVEKRMIGTLCGIVEGQSNRLEALKLLIVTTIVLDSNVQKNGTM